MFSDVTEKKYFGYHITKRFIEAMDHVLGDRSAGKITAKQFGEVVGIKSSNLQRLRDTTGDNMVTVEALGRICHFYNISAFWLLTGQGSILGAEELATSHQLLSKRVDDLEQSYENLQSSYELLKKNLKQNLKQKLLK